MQYHGLVSWNCLNVAGRNHIALVSCVFKAVDVDCTKVIVVAVVGDSEVNLCLGSGNLGAFGIGNLMSDCQVAVAGLNVFDNCHGACVDWYNSVLLYFIIYRACLFGYDSHVEVNGFSRLYVTGHVGKRSRQILVKHSKIAVECASAGVLHFEGHHTRLIDNGRFRVELHLLDDELGFKRHSCGREFTGGMVEVDYRIMILAFLINLPSVGGLQFACEVHLIVSVGQVSVGNGVEVYGP